MSEQETRIKEFLFKLASLKFDYLHSNNNLWPDELFNVRLQKKDKEAWVKVVTVTSGHDRIWIEVAPGNPPVRYTVKDLDKVFEHLKTLLG